MVLYRLVVDKEGREWYLPALKVDLAGNRESASSSFASSFLSFTDSKHPSEVSNTCGMMPYAYYLSADQNKPNEEGLQHDPRVCCVQVVVQVRGGRY